MVSIRICGDGVAAYCCARLFGNAGYNVSLERLDRPRIPAIMLGQQSLALMRDVFEKPDLFADLPRIHHRVVAWGDAPARRMPHSAVVVSEKLLLESLGSPVEAASHQEPDFTVYTSGPVLPGVSEQRFGARRATAARVSLKDQAELSACHIESLPAGWLFLIPNAMESTWLLAIGAPLESLLQTSRLIAPLINSIEGIAAEFSSCPRMLTPICGDNWLACGSAALGFDPLCGDGTAQAVREAILASAVIRATLDGGDKASLLSHYEMMLTASMRRHLALCLDFYRSGGNGPWWQTESDSLSEGYRWCTSRLAHAREPEYQLQGFDLLKRESVAR